MGNFYKYLLRETIEDPGHYHYISFDDFLNNEKDEHGNEYARKKWIDEVKSTCDNLLKKLYPIKNNFSQNLIDKYEPNKVRIYQDITLFIDYIIEHIQDIRKFLSLQEDHYSDLSFLRKIEKDFIFHSRYKYGIQENQIEQIRKSIKNYLLPETAQIIELSADFVEKMFQIFNNNEFKKEILSHQLKNNNIPEEIPRLAERVLSNINKFKSEFPNIFNQVIEEYNFQERYDKNINFLNDIIKAKNISNYDRNGFIQFSIIMSRFTHFVSANQFQIFNKLKLYETNLTRAFKNLILTLEQQYGNLKTESHIIEAEQLFGMPIGKDPALAHAIMFDKAFVDSDDPEDKERWLQSVRNQSRKFRDQVINLRTQMENQNLSIYKKTPSGNELSNFRFYLYDVIHLLDKIYDLGGNGLSGVRDLIQYTKNTGFGIEVDWVRDNFETSPSREATQKILTPGAWNLLEKIVNWCLTVAQTAKQGRTPILDHIYKNHDNQEKQFAKNILEKKQTIEKFISELDTHELNFDEVQSIERIKNNLLANDFDVWKLIKGIANRGIGQRFVDQKIIDKKYIAPIHAFFQNATLVGIRGMTSHTEDIKTALDQMSGQFKRLLLALHRKYGNLQ
jgi:hypothetical protein